MGFLLFTAVIAIANLIVGFAVAMRLGYGPPTLHEGWTALTTYSAQPTRVAPARHAPREAETEDFATEAIEEMFEGLVAAPIEDMLEDEPDDDFDFAPEEEAFDDDTELRDAPESPEMWFLNDKYVETSLMRLNLVMMKSGVRATELDARLRAIRGQADAATVRACLDQLREDCESYLAEQEEAAERFRQRSDELGELSHIAEDIELDSLQQAAQIETTLHNLDEIDLDDDLNGAVERLLGELCHLRGARHTLRDNLESAFLTIARHEDRLDSVEEQLFHDELTGLRGRIGLETAAWQWWHQGRHANRQISVGIFDVDDFRAFNEKHGSAAGDALLKHLAKLLEQNSSRGSLVGRFSGQQFMIFSIDTGPRTAIKSFEFIRQSLERTRLNILDDQVTVTVSVGITEATAEDTDRSVVERAMSTLRAAQAGGANCSFLTDPKVLDPSPELVEAPSLGAEYVEVTLC